MSLAPLRDATADVASRTFSGAVCLPQRGRDASSGSAARLQNDVIGLCIPGPWLSSVSHVAGQFDVIRQPRCFVQMVA